MFGKDRRKADDKDDDDGVPPQSSSSAQDRPTSVQNTDAVRSLLRRPVAGGSGGGGGRPQAIRQPSVRIRRTPSSQSITARDAAPSPAAGLHDIPEESVSGRRRSSSEPQRPSWYANQDAGDRLARIASVNEMPTLAEEGSYRKERGGSEMDSHLSGHLAGHGGGATDTSDFADHLRPHGGLEPPRNGLFRRLSNVSRWVPGVGGSRQSNADTASIKGRPNTAQEDEEYDSEMVDLLDVIDPEVATLSTLTNVQNSLFIPNLGRFVNRRPTYNLSARQSDVAAFANNRLSSAEPDEKYEEPVTHQTTADSQSSSLRPPLTHTSTISSVMSESRYAVLPHGESLAGWTPEEKAELNDLVRHMLHSRRAAFKRGLKGFGQYVKRPLGFFVTLYATLITLFGAAWVFFLIGWISLGSRHEYIIHVVDLVLVALFAIMGDGLAPFRAVDTYHMIYIAHYHHLTWRLRREKHLPKLQNRNDLPSKRNDNEEDIEFAAVENSEERREFRGAWEYSVLSTEQQKKLAHHQAIFARSHTFYKPHETETHFAFPLRLLVAIVVLLDCHSIFQISLGAFTWGWSYKTRPFWVTTFILCCSLTCNITGGILISIGDKRTRKKEVIERMFRQQLTHTAMKEVRKKRIKQNEEYLEQSGGSEGDSVLPVHVPPPVRRSKEIRREMEMKLKATNAGPSPLKNSTAAGTSTPGSDTVAPATGEEHEEVRKNRWRSIPLLPYYLTKESRDFRKAEKQREAEERMAQIAETSAGAGSAVAMPGAAARRE